MSNNGFARLAARLKPADDTDRDLLARFLQQHDEAAFETLVRRHERLVRSAISKVLQHPHDAEDAFQATFLVLVRRARSIDWRAGMGPWLYGVAHRVAVKARTSAQGRQRKEAKATPPADSPADLSWREACDLLHAELDQLPDRYRAPLLLCYLDGKTRDEAAAALGITAGTVKGRLERGRELLRDRLARRGVTLSAGLLAAVAAPGAIASSPASVSAVLAVVRGAASARVVALTREAVVTSILSKLTKSVVVALGLVTVTAALLAAGSAPTNNSNAAQAGAKPKPAADEKAQAFVLPVFVRKPDGTSAAGAKVWAWADGKRQAEATTNADGHANLTVPAGFDKVTLVATADGFGPDWTDARPGAREPYRMALADDVPLEGRLTDLQGQPVANAPVDMERIGRPKPGKSLDEHIANNPKFRHRGTTSLFDLDSIPTAAVGLPTRVTTDKDGRFKFADVGKDRSVRITARGATTEHLQARVVTRAIDPKLEQHGPFGLHGATFTIQVAPSRQLVGVVRDFKTGAGVPGMKVAELRGHICETATDKDGKFILVGLKKDKLYQLGTGSLGEAPYFDVNVTVNDTPGLDPIDVEIKAHRGIVVTGRVTDSKGNPVRAGWVYYGRTYDNPHAKDYPGIDDSHHSISYWGHLDRDGRYKALTIPGPAALGVCSSPEDAFPRLDGKKEMDARNIRGYPNDAMHAAASVDINPADPKTLTHDFTLSAGKVQTLRITGADGKLPAKLLAVGQTETWEPRPVTGDSLTITGLSPKRNRAVVLIDDAKTVGAVATVSGDSPATVTLAKLGSLTGRVLDAEGMPAAGAEVRVWLLLDGDKYDNLPDEVHGDRGVFGITRGAWQHFTGRTTKADKDGRFTVPGLLPGEKYQFAAGFNMEKEGGELLHKQNGVTVTAGEAKNLGDLKPAK